MAGIKLREGFFTYYGINDCACWINCWQLKLAYAHCLQAVFLHFSTNVQDFTKKNS